MSGWQMWVGDREVLSWTPRPPFLAGAAGMVRSVRLRLDGAERRALVTGPLVVLDPARSDGVMVAAAEVAIAEGLTVEFTGDVPLNLDLPEGAVG